MRDEAGAFWVGILLGVLFGGIMATIIVTDAARSAIIERGYAGYCPSSGAFAWNGECDQ